MIFSVLSYKYQNRAFMKTRSKSNLGNAQRVTVARQVLWVVGVSIFSFWVSKDLFGV